MLNRIFKFSALLLLCIVNVPAYAKLFGKATLTTDGIWRGISQTRGRGAAQVEIGYDILDSGLYAKVYGANVNFSEEQYIIPGLPIIPPIARIEFDYIAGFRHDFNDDWSIDFGITDYEYPGVSDYNYKEGFGTITYKYFNLNLAYSDNNFNTRTDGYYGALEFTYPLFKDSQNIILKDLYTNAHIGYFKLNPMVGIGSYTDYQVSLVKVLENFDFELGFTTTSGMKIKPPDATARVYFTVSKEF